MISPIDELIENNRKFAETFSKGELVIAPRKKLAIVACMDSRMLMHEMIGLMEGNAHVIRNAGGIITEDVIRSLTISQRLLGTEEIMLIHHTNCGIHNLNCTEFKDLIESETGLRPTFSFKSSGNAVQDVRESIECLRNSPFLIHKDRIRGFVYNVKIGLLEEVL